MDPITLGSVAAIGSMATAGMGAVSLATTAASIPINVAGATLQAQAAAQQSMAESEVSTYRAGMSRYQKGLAGYQAGISLVNQRIALQNADYARSVGETEAALTGVKTRQQVGAIRAAQSGSGVDVSSGTSARVAESQQYAGQYEASVERSNAAKLAYGHEVEAFQAGEQARLTTAQGELYEMQANIYERQSGMQKLAASNALQAGGYNVTSAMLGGAGNVASKWLQAKQYGLFGGGSTTPSGGSGSPGVVE